MVLVHDWLTGMRGGEKCLEAALPPLAATPGCYTLLHRRGSVSPAIERARIRASFLKRLPGVDRYYRYLLPADAVAAGWRVADADLVVSFSHCVAKSAQPPRGRAARLLLLHADALRLAHAGRVLPASGLLGQLKAAAVDRLLARIRDWDRRTADRVTHFIAISSTVQHRIRECYGRDSTRHLSAGRHRLLHAQPIGRARTSTSSSRRSRRTSGFDLAVEACRKLGRQAGGHRQRAGRGEAESRGRAGRRSSSAGSRTR